MVINLILFGLAMGLTFLVLSFLKRIHHRKRLPKVSAFGGCAFFIVFTLLYLLIFALNIESFSKHLHWAVIFSSILFIVEIIDDFKDFSLRCRLVTQVLFTAGFLFYGKPMQIYFLPIWLNYILSFLWIMGITNAFNLLDIADGLCSGVSVIISIAFLIVAILTGNFLLTGLWSVILGITLVFLLFNFPPAKIYMGNSGSHFLGFLFATLSIYGDYSSASNTVAIILPILILGLPILDTGYLVFARINKNILPMRKSKDHIFLRLLAKGYSHKLALGANYAVAGLWSLTGITLIFGFSYFFVIFLILAVISSIVVGIKASNPKIL